MTPPTAADRSYRDKRRLAHESVRFIGAPLDDTRRVCTRCRDYWPCETIRAYDALDAAEADRERLRAALEPFADKDRWFWSDGAWLLALSFHSSSDEPWQAASEALAGDAGARGAAP